jgi:hypothetical protein
MAGKRKASADDNDKRAPPKKTKGELASPKKAAKKENDGESAFAWAEGVKVWSLGHLSMLGR